MTVAQRRLVFLISAAAALLSAPAEGKEHPGGVSGVFSNVAEHPETGDLLGLEVEIHANVPQPYVFVTLCEGWCNASYRVPAELSGNQVQFSFAEQFVGQDGKPAGEDRYELKGRVVGRRLIIFLRTHTDSNHEYSSHETLTRRPKRFGLAVAHLMNE